MFEGFDTAMRTDNRSSDDLRPVKITPNFIKHAEGSVLIEMGDTKVICNASVEERVPPFLVGTGTGWVTAEYSMLPRATKDRNQRDISKLKLSPRSAEIQRLVGRALRGVVDFKKLGERTITIDCDVIQADGGTRTASVTGGYVALALAVKKLLNNKVITQNPIETQVAAVSVGIVNEEIMLDLCYVEDSGAEVDMNVVMTGKGEFVEVQGTGEGRGYTKAELDSMIALAENGIKKLFVEQNKVLTD